jgi:hypothetical protein
MKKTILVFIAALLFPSLNTVEAKLTIIPPQRMIDGADFIIIGTITKKVFSEQNREVQFTINSVLKGEIKQKEMTLNQDLPHMYGWLGFDFPDKGSKVMVFLGKYNSGTFLEGDTNSVATIENNQVHLYHGATMGGWTPKLYDAAYQAFFDEHKESINTQVVESTPIPKTSQSNMQVTHNVQNSEIVIAPVKHFTVRVMVISFLLLLLLAYAVFKWRKYQ